ncbi:MAG: M23 family metallopeptidase [Oscillospiraceae bacterium]|nr:M23 family metallopeptidase [Oscillospiraceae bacterium]
MKPIDKIKYKKILLFFLVIVFFVKFIIFGTVTAYQAIDLNQRGIWTRENNAEKATTEEAQEESDHIKWVDFNLTVEVMEKTSKLDIHSHVYDEEVKLNWIELISYLACKYGNNFSSFKQQDLDDLVAKLQGGATIEELTEGKKYFAYYLEAYTAILGEFIGLHHIQAINQNGEKVWEERYGIKAFLPIAKGYYFSHYDDFGNSRNYGYRRAHLGNDLMGSVGTPIIAVESGIVEAAAWNQYGGWRIGIRSFDGKRYYYYAHLRKDRPFIQDMYEGKIIAAGDVIGYLGMTGYSTKENVNNINVPHLHFGLQLIFHESQKEGINQIWIDVYPIINFLKRNRSEVHRPGEADTDYVRKFEFMEENLHD